MHLSISIKYKEMSHNLSQLLINFLNALCFTTQIMHILFVEPDAGQDPASKKTKFQCCDYTTAWPNALRQHKDTQHEGIRYPPSKKTKFQCDSCDYTTAQANVLRQHKKFKHEGMRYRYR